MSFVNGDKINNTISNMFSKEAIISNMFSKEAIRSVWENLTGTILDRIKYEYILFVDDKDDTSGIVIYCDYTGTACTMHVYMPKQVNRSSLRKVFNYAFNTLGVDRVFLEIKSTLDKSIDNAYKIGFKRSTYIEDRYGLGIGQLIMVADRNDLARWIK